MKRVTILLTMLMVISLGISAQKLSFKADIDTMSPMSYPSKSGLTDFSFEMRNDSAFVYLPYMGNVYNPSFNNDGLNFNEPCQNLKVTTRKKKDGNDISFTLRHDNVRYDFNINLFDNGSIWLNMQPSNAQSCSYSGRSLQPINNVNGTKCQETPKVIVEKKSKSMRKKRSSKSFKSGMYVGGSVGI